MDVLHVVGFLIMVVCGVTGAPIVETYDVLVYAGNSGGVGAAVTASVGGKYRVKVMEPLTMIGGMGAAGGVALMNQGCGLEGVTGLAKNWSLLCGEYYGEMGKMVVFPSMNVSAWAFWKLLNSSSSISTSLGCRAVGARRSKNSGCINQVDFSCNGDRTPVTIQASYVIDASYDGDIMALAGGISYTYGREPREKYNESLAGVSLLDHQLESFEEQGLYISPYFPNGTILPYIDPKPMPTPGTGDDKVMAFEYFVCLSQTTGNQVPFYPPPGYNPDDFTLLLRQINGFVVNKKYPEGPPLKHFGDVQCYDEIVEKVTGNRDCLYCCGPSPVDSDQPDLNHGWPAANYSRRLELARAHRYYIQGSLYFMATDPRVPEFTRKDTLTYGYCKDEYKEHGNFPPQLYVRISNRLQGEFLLTQNNIANPRVKKDSVAMGCWEFDQHTVSRHPSPDSKHPGHTVVRNEGFFRIALGNPQVSCDHKLADCSSQGNWYDVPFGVMVPRKGQASNLLVPVAISSTSVAYASTRIENMFMDLGSAAGVAVSLLLDRAGGGRRVGGCPGESLHVQDTNITQVQDILVTVYRQRVHGPPTPLGPASYDVIGAGAMAWNGKYSFIGHYTDQRPVFVKVGDDGVRGGYRLYSYARTWRLGVEGEEVFYVAGQPTNGTDPPLVGWRVANGTAPAPQLMPDVKLR